MSRQDRRDTQRTIFATAVIPGNITVPAGERWLVKVISFTYTADATVGTRFVRVSLRVGGAEKLAREVAVDITADDVIQGLFAPNVSIETVPGVPDADNTYRVIMPEFVALAGDVIRVDDSVGVSAADTVEVFVHHEIDYF
jgi:hypothetical protein